MILNGDASSIILDVTKTSCNNKQGLSEGDQSQPLVSADNPYLNLGYSGAKGFS